MTGILEPLVTFSPYILAGLRIVFGLNFFVGRGVRHLFTARKETIKQWTERGIPAEAIYLVGVLNFIGALFLIAGFLVTIVSACFAIFMASTIYAQRYLLKRPYFGHGVPSYELNLLYFVLAILFIVVGGGPFSVDSLLGL